MVFHAEKERLWITSLKEKDRLTQNIRVYPNNYKKIPDNIKNNL
jgi:hypothetical protein